MRPSLQECLGFCLADFIFVFVSWHRKSCSPGWPELPVFLSLPSGCWWAPGVYHTIQFTTREESQMQTFQRPTRICIRENVQHLPLGAQVTSFNTVFSSSIHFPTNSFMTRQTSTCVRIIALIHSSADGHSGCLFAVTNSNKHE